MVRAPLLIGAWLSIATAGILIYGFDGNFTLRTAGLVFLVIGVGLAREHRSTKRMR